MSGRPLARRLVGLAAASLAMWTALAPSAQAQPLRATIRGQVLLVDGVAVPDLPVTLRTDDGAIVATAVSSSTGRFDIRDVAPGTYHLFAVSGAVAGSTAVEVGLTSVIDTTLSLSATFFRDDVMVTGALAIVDRSTATFSGDTLRALPARLQSRALPQALAAAPGWAEEDNGLLHVRGVDDGVLYVEDGIPVYDRLDVAFGIPPALAGAGTVSITTGHTPAQFGLKSGGVVQVFSPPAPGRWSGQVDAGSGSAALGSVATSSGGPLGPVDVYAAAAAERSDRFLDPVHPNNLHNIGGVAGGALRARFAPSPNALITANVRAGRSRFDVPHGEEPEKAGQDQRQRIGQYAQSLAWQQAFARALVSLGGYHRTVDARLLASAGDTPLSAASTRRTERRGLLGSTSYAVGRHDVTAGAEVALVAIREDFRFAVTDPDSDGLSAAAKAFTPAHPFTFAGDAARAHWSAYVQDRTSIGSLAVDAGVRFDRTNLLVRASQWSPRVGLAFDLGRVTMRASYNRFFQPPQAEHLLLSSSEEARAFSPFVGDGEGGSAPIAPERQTAWELGADRSLGAHLRLDVAAWHRDVRNYTDPNVFFGTTIVFPNSVARGTAKGLDLRLSLPAAKGWTATASYMLSKVEQEGPINGGLFLEDDNDELGSGVRFTPDHDQRHVAAASVAWTQPMGVWSASAQARYASGTPLEVGELDDDDRMELATRPGADLIDLDRGRVKPRLVVDVAASRRVRRTPWAAVSLSASVLNVFDRRYAFNFGNPFSGTHFGAPRQFRVDARISFD